MFHKNEISPTIRTNGTIFYSILFLNSCAVYRRLNIMYSVISVKLNSPPSRVPVLPIKDCTSGCNNRAQMCTQLSAICVTARTFFERLYLVLGLGTFGPWVKCPYAPTTPPIQLQLFLDFWAIVFPGWPLNFFGTRFTKYKGISGTIVVVFTGRGLAAAECITLENLCPRAACSTAETPRLVPQASQTVGGG